jgi:O-antigen/teichoic acid export membrane protein
MLKKLLQYAPVQIISALSIFLLIAIQTKFLGIDDYGMLAIFFLVSEVVRSFSAQWVNTSMLRLYPTEKSDNKKHYQTVAICLLAALFVPATGLIAIVIFYYDLFTWSIFFSLALLLLSKSAYLFLLDMARLNDQAGAYRLSSLLQSVISILATYLLLSYQADFENAVLALVISYFVVLPFVMFKLTLSTLPAAKPFVMPIISYGVPLMLSGTLASLTSRVDRLFIADAIGLNATGVYAALSNMLLGVMALVFMVIAMPLYPEMTKAISNKVKLASLHAKYVNVLFLFSFPALLGLCLIAEPMISFFLTAEYLQYGVELFYIIALSVFVLNCRAHYVDHGLQFTLNTRLLPIITGVSIIINVSLLFLLIDKYGVYGAAYASLFTNIITLLLSFNVARYKGYQYHFNFDFIKIIIASIAMFLCMLLVRNMVDRYSVIIQLVVLVLCGVISYMCANLVLNTVNARSYVRKVLFK